MTEAARRGLLVVAAALGLLAAAPAAASAAGPLDLAGASLTQVGQQLRLTVHTRGEWAARALTSRPGRSLCLVVSQAGRRGFVCATASGHRAGLSFTQAGGATQPLRATIDRPDLKTLVASFATRDAGLAVGPVRWVVTTTWRDSGTCADGCADRLPARGSNRLTILPPTPTGCRARSPWYWTRGPGHRKVVALTFDDGPSPYTHLVLDILARNHIHGTFFLIGQQVRGNEALLRRSLREGNVLGNHTFTHANVSGGAGSQITSTQGAIRRATGYTPCVFRAPYGAVSGTLIGQARGLRLDTIQWDVDPRDWSRPGTGAIYSRIVGAARRESIILMHDGGGPRNQTVAALPQVIRTLRARGYGFVTLPQLLGLRLTYG
jgi:peptidoglycan/xylan/chitin deacetylase (PgdA/CDA1 family)